MSNEKMAHRLRLLRGTKKAKEVSEAIGITSTALSNYENGYRVPRDEIKSKLAKYYGVTVDEIFFAN